jgi:hypothetical protein
MLTLFVNGTLLDNLTNVMLWLREDSMIMMWVFVIFILVSSFTVLNMLIGVLCEVVTATSESENEAMTQAEASLSLRRVFKEIDEDKSGLISFIEFDKMKENEAAIEALEKLGIEMHMVKGLSEVLFQADEDEHPPEEVNNSMSPRSVESRKSQRRASVDAQRNTKELTFKEFLERLSHLKPGTPVSVLDFADLQKQLRSVSRKVEGKIKDLQKRLENLGAPADPDAVDASTTDPASPYGSEKKNTTEDNNSSTSKGSSASLQVVADAPGDDETPVVQPEDLSQVSTDDLLNELYSRLGGGSHRSKSSGR